MFKMGKSMKYRIEKSRKNKKYQWSILFLFLLIIITFSVIFLKYDIREIFKCIQEVNYLWLGLGILMIFLYVYFEGVAMRQIFKTMEIQTTRRSNFMYSAIDYYFCAVTPSASGGQPMVAYYMAKDGLSLSHLSLTLLTTRSLFKIILLVLSIICICICPQYVFDFPIMTILFFIGLVINLILISMCFLAAFKRNWIQAVGIRLILFLARHRIIKKKIQIIRRFVNLMEKYEQGAHLIFKHKFHFLKALLYNLLQRISFFSISYFVYLAFKDRFVIANLTYLDLFSIQVLIALCVDSLPLPGGVGISEYLYALLFGLVYCVGEVNVIGSAMLLTRAVNFYIPLILTFLLVLIKHVKILKKSSKGVV